MKEKIRYEELTGDRIKLYNKIPSVYNADKKYELKKIDDGLGGILLELKDTKAYYKDFGNEIDNWTKKFDFSNWKVFIALNEQDEPIAGCVVATKTPNCNMLEGKDDLAVLWDLRVREGYKYMGIGRELFNMVKNFAKENGFKKLKVECQNTNPVAVRFYHKQGMQLSVINEYAYSEFPNEVQLLWYMDI